MRKLVLLLLLTTGCPPGDPVVELISEDLDGGALLSAWSDGPTLRMAGGHLGSGPGTLAQLDGDALCIEQDVTERALWWIHGARQGEWYAVGEGGTVLHEVDGVRTREDLPTDVTLFGVYDDGEAVWAVGGMSRIAVPRAAEPGCSSDWASLNTSGLWWAIQACTRRNIPNVPTSTPMKTHTAVPPRRGDQREGAIGWFVISVDMKLR